MHCTVDDLVHISNKLSGETNSETELSDLARILEMMSDMVKRVDSKIVLVAAPNWNNPKLKDAKDGNGKVDLNSKVRRLQKLFLP